MRALAWAGALILASAPAAAQQPATVTIRAGTAVPLVTVDTLDTRRHRQGDPVKFVVAADVMAGDRIVIPKGSAARGEVTRHISRAYFGQSGRLEVRLLYVTIGSLIVRLDGAAEGGRGDARFGTALAASLIGTFMAGEDGAIPAGTGTTGYVHRDIAVPASPPPPS